MATGPLAVARDAPIGVTTICIPLNLDQEASEGQRARLLTSAERACVVSQTLKNPPPMTLIGHDGTAG